MKTLNTIFGGKLMRWIVLFFTLTIITELYAQPCSNPPTAYISTDNSTICQGSTTRVFFHISGGTPPWRITYAIDGVTQPIIANITNSPYSLTTGTGGLYTIQSVYDAQNCQGTIYGSGVNIRVIEKPIVEAGPNINNCSNDPIQLNGYAENYSSVRWTSTGNGTFSNENSLTTIYYPGTSNISSGSAVLTLTVYPISPCTQQVSDQLTVTIAQGPTANAGPDFVNCGTSSYYITGSSASSYSTVSWSTSGTGTFLNPTNLHPTYNPSLADVLAGSVTLTLSVNGVGNCSSYTTTDEMVLYINPLPVANAGSAAMVCAGSSLIINDATASNYSTLSWITSGSGTFANNGTLTPTYIPSNADITAGSVTLTLRAFPLAPCTQPATSSKVLTFVTNPTVNAGPDGSVCGDSPYLISGAQATNYSNLLWTTSGTGSFTSTSTLNTTYLPSAADVQSGTVVLTLTAYGNSTCNFTASDSRVLTLTSLPVCNAGIDASICQSSTYTINTATASSYSSIQWTTNGTGVLINQSTLSPSYIPSHNDALAGTVTLTMTVTGSASCNNITATDNMQLTITPNPIVNAGNDQTMCSETPLTITGATAQFYSSVTWTTSGTGSFTNQTTLSPTYTPSAADIALGSVTLTITAYSLSPCTASATDNLVVTISKPATANAGIDYTICIGSYQITTASATNYSSLSWVSSGTGTFTNASTLSPTYTPSTLDISNGFVNLTLIAQSQSPCASQAVDFMVLTLPGNAVVEAGTDATICEGTSFQITTASASNYSNIVWASSGTGYFSGQNTVNAVYYPSNADITLGSVILTLTGTAVSPCANTVSDQMTLTIVRAPQANAGPDQTICEGSNALLNGTTRYSSMFVWSTSGDGTFLNAATLTPTYIPGTNDINAGSVTITLIAYTAGICTNSAFDNMIIYIKKEATVSAGNDATICNNMYTLSTATASNYSTLMWTTSGTGIFMNPTALNATYIASIYDISSGSITLTLTAAGNSPCSGLYADQMVLTFTPNPIVFAGIDASTCGNSSYTISDSYAQNYSAITWSTSGTGVFSNTSAVNPTYYPSAADYTNGQVTLTLTATGYNFCNLTSSDQMILHLNTQPVANAGDDILSCDGNPIQVTGATASNYVSILWTHNGSGIIQGATGLNPVYIPSQNDILAGQVILTLNVTASAPCTGVASDQMVITIGAGPAVSAGSDITVCQNENLYITGATAINYTTLTWATSGSGTFSNSTILNPIYYPSSGDIANGTVILTLSATGVSPCNTVSADDMTLTLNKLPIANAGPDAILCGSSYHLTLATAQNFSAVSWTTSGTGTFNNTNTLNPVYTPGLADLAAGNVTLTLTVNGQSPCNTQSIDAMVLTFGDQIIANAGADASVCGSNPFTITSASATAYSTIMWSSSGTGTFSNQNSLNPTYTPSANDVLLGYVILTMQLQGSAPCFAYAQDDMTLTIAAPTTVYAGSDVTICKGTSYTINNASASNYTALTWASNGTGTFVSGNTLSPTYMPSASDYQAGSVILTLTGYSLSPCTSSVSDEMLITFADSTIANAGPDQDICAGSSFVVTQASAINASAISWISTGSGTLINQNTLAPTYIPSSADILAGSVRLILTANGNTPCLGTSTDEMMLTIKTLPQGLANIQGTDSVCAGQTNVIYTIAPDVLYATSYTWSMPPGATIVSGQGTSSVTVDFALTSTSGNIFATPINSCGVGVPSPFFVAIKPLTITPGAIIGPDQVCVNSTSIQYSIAPVPNATSYIWTVPTGVTIVSGTGTNSITVDFASSVASGNITVAATNNCGTSLPSTLFITILTQPAQPVITANGPTTFCLGGSVILSATPGFPSYLWSNGMTTQSITVTQSGIYSVTVADNSGCGSLPSNEITVVVNQAITPTITANGPTTFCNGDNVTLTASDGYSSYQWSNGAVTQSIIVTQTGNYFVTATDLNGCVSSPSAPVYVSVIESQVAVNAGPDGSICAGNLYNISGATAQGYSTLQWTTSGTGTFNNISILNPTYNPSPSDIANGTVQLTLTATAIAPCNNTISDTRVLQIKSTPNVFAGNDGFICQGTNYLISDAIADNYSTIQWTTSGTGTFVNGTTISPLYIPSQLDIITGSVTITLIATNAPCFDATDSQVLTIIPTATADAGPDATICTLCSYTVTGATVNNASSFTWTSTGTGTLTNANTLSPTYQPSQADINSGSVTLILSAESGFSCGSISDQMIIYINQTSQLEFTWEEACKGQPTLFFVDETITPVGTIATWHWNFGDGFYSNVMNPTHTYAASGNYTVTLTATDTTGVQSVAIRQVEIKSLPIAFFSWETPNCTGDVTNFINLSSTETGYINTWIWNYGDGSQPDTIQFPANPNVSHTYLTQGTYNVILTVINSFGCENTFSANVTTTTAPIANFHYTSSCANMTVDFQDASHPNGGGNIVSWAWDFGDPSSGVNNFSNLSTPQHIYSTPGIYTVTLLVTNFNNCTGTITKTINTGTAPDVAFTWQTGCANSTTMFNVDETVVNVGAIAGYLWNFGDGGQSTEQNPQHLYVSAGNYNVSLTITDTIGCANTVVNIVTIGNAPNAFFSFTQPTCFGSPMQFTDLSSSSFGYITTWEWNFGDGNSQVINFPANPNVSHNYTQAGTFSVKLDITTSTGCEHSVTRIVTVTPAPVANFDYTTACLNQPTTFTDLSQANGGGQIISWSWDFGDPLSGTGNTSTLQNPVHIYNQPGSYFTLLTVITSNGCTNTMTKTVVINPAPTVDFTFTTGCANENIQFNSSSFVNINTTLSWLWNFGDGTTANIADPQHAYAIAGTYNVTLTISDVGGCIATISHFVNVLQGPVALFNYNIPACSGSDVQFNDLSTANGTPNATWYWDFGDGTNTTVTAPGDPNVLHTYANPGSYTVALTVTNMSGCSASYSSTINIIVGPTANFTYQTGCQGTPVQFTDISISNGGPAIVAWQWNFDDPMSGTSNISNLQNPSHAFTTSGYFNVSLTTTSFSGCQNTIVKSVLVSAPSAAAFIYSSNCAKTDITFQPDQSVVNPATIVSYLWDFGDGTPISNQMSPIHVYTIHGTYTVSMVITDLNGCVSSISQNITINSVPVVAFSANSTCTGNSSMFTDHSYSPDGNPLVAWAWSFGDIFATSFNDTSNIQNPSYNYSQAGIYDVRLTATTSTGCYQTVTLPIEVVASPTASYSYSTNACANGRVSFVDESVPSFSAITKWTWEFQPYYYSNLQNPFHTFATDSCYNVKLIITDSRNCTDTTIQEVCVPPSLQLGIDYTQTCFGDTTWFNPVVIAPQNTTLIKYRWNFDDVLSGTNNTSTLQNPYHYFDKVGTYLVSLSATDINNCEVTVYQNVEVKKLPLPKFSYTAGNCDSTLYFRDLSSGNGSNIATWIWEFGDGQTDTVYSAPADVSHYYSNTGTFTIKLTTITTAGCRDTYSMTIEKLPCLQAGFTSNTTAICEGQSITFIDNSFCGNPINKWEWYFGDGTTETYTSFTPIIIHSYSKFGTYNVSLVVTSTVGLTTISDTLTRSVKVFAKPIANFNASKLCINSDTYFYDESEWIQTRIKSWKWNFGDQTSIHDTSTAVNPVYRFPEAGKYNTTLTVISESGCSDTVTKEVEIHYLPQANFTYNVACQNLQTQFKDISNGADTTISQWWWKIKDSTNMLGLAGVSNPNFVFKKTGSYEVELIVINANGCSDTISKVVKVNPRPISAFSMIDNYENTQGRVKFTNGSLGATAYEWNFDTGIVSFSIDPVVDFLKDGDYSISLISLNEFDCPDTLKVKYSLLFKGLWVPNAFSPNNPNEEVRLFKPIGINLQAYTLEIFDTWGNLLWFTNKLDEKGAPAEGWNGMYNGNMLPQDTYMWKATAVFKDGTIWNGINVGKNDKLSGKTYGTVHLIR